MAAPRFGQGSGMVNPEAPGTPVQPRIAQPTPGISTGQRTTNEVPAANPAPPIWSTIVEPAATGESETVAIAVVFPISQV